MSKKREYELEQVKPAEFLEAVQNAIYWDENWVLAATDPKTKKITYITPTLENVEALKKGLDDPIGTAEMMLEQQDEINITFKTIKA